VEVEAVQSVGSVGAMVLVLRMVEELISEEPQQAQEEGEQVLVVADQVEAKVQVWLLVPGMTLDLGA